MNKIFLLFFINILLIDSTYAKSISEQESEVQKIIKEKVKENITSTNNSININSEIQTKKMNNDYVYKVSALISEYENDSSSDSFSYLTEIKDYNPDDLLYSANPKVGIDGLVSNNNNKNSNEDEKEKIFEKSLTGYCTFPNELEINKLSGYAYLNCTFSEIGEKKLAVLIKPDFYSEALIGKPLYFPDEKLRSLTVEGVVLNATKTSLNIANIINNYKVEKIIANGTYNYLPKITKIAQQFLKRKEEESKDETIATNSNANDTNIVKATNYEKIDPTYYIVNAGIELVSSFFKSIVDANNNNVTYTFKISKGAMVFVDLLVSNKKNTYRGVNGSDNNLIIHQSPLIKQNSTNTAPSNIKIKTGALK